LNVVWPVLNIKVFDQVKISNNNNHQPGCT